MVLGGGNPILPLLHCIYAVSKPLVKLMTYYVYITL